MGKHKKVERRREIERRRHRREKRLKQRRREEAGVKKHAEPKAVGPKARTAS